MYNLLMEIKEHPACIEIYQDAPIYEYQDVSNLVPKRFKGSAIEIKMMADLMTEDEIIKIYKNLSAQKEFRFKLIFIGNELS